MNVWLLVVFAVVSLPAFAMGYAMREKKRIDLISGVDPSNIADPDGLARFFGNAMYAIGFVAFFGGAAVISAPREDQMAAGIAWVVLVNVIVLILVVGVVRRTRPRRER